MPSRDSKSIMKLPTELFFRTQFEADAQGHFGEFGGRYVPEMLIPALDELAAAYTIAIQDPGFIGELNDLYINYIGRPSPLYYAERLTHHYGGAQIYLKNEGVNHTGAHKINHCVGQALLAKRMQKKRLIAETGAGQHGVATATVAAKFGFACTIHMGKVDMERQAPNVQIMRQLGADIVPVSAGSQTLKDAVTSAMQDWLGDPIDSYYLLGSALGPHPYPTMVRDFQSIIGLEVAQQLPQLPDYIVACVGGGSNAIGIFNAFLDQSTVQLIGVEAGGRNTNVLGEHAARLANQPQLGVIEGYKSFFLQDDFGNIAPTHSVSAGLDYPGIGPQHAYLHSVGRVQYVSISDDEAIKAVHLVSRLEGIIPALESAHAIAHTGKLAPTLSPEKIIVVNVSGRGDKDMHILEHLTPPSPSLGDGEQYNTDL